MPEVTTETISSDPASEDHSPEAQTQENPNADLQEYLTADGTVDAEKLADAYRKLRDGNEESGEDTEGGGADGGGQGDEGGDDEQQSDGPPERQAADDVLAGKGVDLSALETEFTKNNGKLTDASYEKLDKAGFPRALVDNYIAGQTARAANYTTAIYDAAGGQESFDQLSAWAAENLNQADINAVNKVLASGDIATARLTLGGLAAQANLGGSGSDAGADNDGGSPFIQPRNSSPGGSTPKAFGSEYERTKAMQDERYGRDPAYTSRVEDMAFNMEN